MDRRAFLLLTGAATLGACAHTERRGSYEPTEVPAPRLTAGDRWIYRRTDGFTGLPRGLLTRQVHTQPEGWRIAVEDENGIVLDDARFSTPGVQSAGTLSEEGPFIAGRFEPGFIRYDFPLIAGKQWRQGFDRYDAGGFREFVTVWTQVLGWEDVQVGDRAMRALMIDRYFNLGPKDPFHGNTYRSEREWYVPALRGFARLESSEEFHKRHGVFLGDRYNGDRLLWVLQSYQLG